MVSEDNMSLTPVAPDSADLERAMELTPVVSESERVGGGEMVYTPTYQCSVASTPAPTTEFGQQLSSKTGAFASDSQLNSVVG